MKNLFFSGKKRFFKIFLKIRKKWIILKISKNYASFGKNFLSSSFGMITQICMLNSLKVMIDISKFFLSQLSINVIYKKICQY